VEPLLQSKQRPGRAALGRSRPPVEPCSLLRRSRAVKWAAPPRGCWQGKQGGTGRRSVQEGAPAHAAGERRWLAQGFGAPCRAGGRPAAARCDRVRSADRRPENEAWELGSGPKPSSADLLARWVGPRCCVACGLCELGASRLLRADDLAPWAALRE
jgi:hypothetical protein